MAKDKSTSKPKNSAGEPEKKANKGGASATAEAPKKKAGKKEAAVAVAVPVLNYSKLAPSDIHGVPKSFDSETPATIKQHKEFVNPRSSMDAELIERIKTNGFFDQPITVYMPEGGKKYVVIDGNTRLTAAARYAQENDGNFGPFSEIPAVVISGLTDVQAYAKMGSLNFEDNRKQLSPLDQARFALDLERRGLTELEQLAALGRHDDAGHANLRWLRSLKAVASNDDVAAAVDDKVINVAAAKRIAAEDAKKPGTGKAAIEKARKAASAGASPKEAAAAAGATKSNRTMFVIATAVNLLRDAFPGIVAAAVAEYKSSGGLVKLGKTEILQHSFALGQLDIFCEAFKVTHSPFTSQQTLDKVGALGAILAEYQFDVTVERAYEEALGEDAEFSTLEEFVASFIASDEDEEEAEDEKPEKPAKKGAAKKADKAGSKKPAKKPAAVEEDEDEDEDDDEEEEEDVKPAKKSAKKPEAKDDDDDDDDEEEEDDEEGEEDDITPAAKKKAAAAKDDDDDDDDEEEDED